MAATEHLRNYLMTLSIDPKACQGFEDEALGACVGLVGWGWAGSDKSRLAWMHAVTTAAVNSSGGLSAGPGNKSFFYSSLKNRQRSAFQASAFSPPDWSKFDASDYPWALPEPLFRSLDSQVRQSKGLAGQKAVTWDQVTKTVHDYEAAIGLTGPLGWLGKKMFNTFLTKYAPEFAAGALAQWGVGVAGGVAFVAVAAQMKIVPISNAQTKKAFEIDKMRRDYDIKAASSMVSR